MMRNVRKDHVSLVGILIAEGTRFLLLKFVNLIYHIFTN
jgi:hypothetical protein